MTTTTTPRLLLLLSLAAAGAACSSEVSSTVLARPVLDGAVSDGASTAADAPTPDAAAPDDAPPPWMPPAGTDTSCVSNTRWNPASRPSALMAPGQACLTCHARRTDAADPEPFHVIGGTAYYALHEVDNCYGFTGLAPNPTGAAYVELVDADGTMLRLRVGRSGNFGTSSALVFPLRSARVVGPTGLVNEMGSEVPHGDCNACHTEAGTTTEPGADPAPGRITVPL